MSEFNLVSRNIFISGLILCGFIAILSANEPSEIELELWKQEFIDLVKEGEKNFNDERLSKNGLACGQCHMDGENTHPESYPKFKNQLWEVVNIGQMINWCIVNPLKGKALELDSKKMLSLISYLTYQRRGVKLDPGKD